MEMVSIATKELEFGDEIGSGSEGSVFKGEWRLVKSGMEEIREVAIKKLLISSDLSELKALSGLSHPNIINVFGFVEEHHELCIVMELCQYSLCGYFERNPSPLSDKNLLRWSLEAALPLEYLRKHNILHRDVKPENYVVDSGMVLKLTDFGMARELGCTVSKFTQVGTWRWMAPEVHGVKDKRLLLSPSYDIFALGLVLWYLVTRKMPYSEYLNNFTIAQAIINGERPIIPAECPVKLADLIQKCWSGDRKDRPDISQIILLVKDMIASLEITDKFSHLQISADDEEASRQDEVAVASALEHAGSSSLISAEDKKASKQDEVTIASSLENAGSSSLISAEDGKASIQDEVSVASSLEHTGSSSLISAEDGKASKPDEVTVASSLEHAGSSSLLLLQEKTPKQDVAVASYLEYSVSNSKVSATEKVSRKRAFVAGPWVLERKFGGSKLPYCQDVAVNTTNGDIAVTVKDKQVQLYTSQGEYKHSLDTKLPSGSISKPWNITVSSKGYYYVTDRTEFVKVYDASGVYKGRWVAISPENIPSDADKDTALWGLAIDEKDQLLVGVHCHYINYISSRHKSDLSHHNYINYISRHKCDGSHIASIKVGTRPHYLAPTSQETVVVSDCVHYIVNEVDINTGQLLHTVRPPTSVKSWNPWGICYWDDIIYICGMAMSSKDIHCFSVLGEYLGHIATGTGPTGITFLKESNQLFVSVFGGVEVYTRQK